MRVHERIVLYTHVPTRTQSVYTRVLLLVPHSKYILQSSYFVSVLQILVRVFPRIFHCRIGLQTMRSVEQRIEDLASVEIKEPVMSECHK